MGERIMEKSFRLFKTNISICIEINEKHIFDNIHYLTHFFSIWVHKTITDLNDYRQYDFGKRFLFGKHYKGKKYFFFYVKWNTFYLDILPEFHFYRFSILDG